MIPLQEDYEKMSDEQLRQIIRQDLEGEAEHPVETILMICDIYTRRHPHKKDAQTAFREFMEHYYPFADE